MIQPFTASQQIEKKTKESTFTVAYKVFEYREELARKKRRNKQHSQKKLELTMSLALRTTVEDNEYHWNKHFRESIDRTIHRQKVKFEIALYMTNLRLKKKKMDRGTILQHCKVFYKTLTKGTATSIDSNSQPEAPRLIKVRRKIQF